MTITVHLFGAEVFSLTIGADAEADDDPAAALNGGSLTSYPVGFVAAYDLPDEVPFPQRTPAWDDEE